MHSFVLTLNHLGARLEDLALPIFLQSTLLIALIWAIDRLTRTRLRPAVRYALWCVVLVKLVTPPSFALPTGPAWWLRLQEPSRQPAATVQITTASPTPVSMPHAPSVPAVMPDPKLTASGIRVVVFSAITLGLLGWIALRWREVSVKLKSAHSAGAALFPLTEEALALAGLRRYPEVRLVQETMSPSVCGLLRPIVVLPQELVSRLSREQLKAVLLHEFIHLRRGDIWVNFLQAMLQVLFWWHPFVWLANARIRQLREEAVDDAVMLALRGEAREYAPTLVEVAKLTLDRPLIALGLVGIMESKSALRQRIERLLGYTAPRKAGLTIASALGLLAFSAIAVPMGQPPMQTRTDTPNTGTIILTNTIRDITGSGPILATQTIAVVNNPPGTGAQLAIEVKFAELRHLDPASEPADSPLRLLPQEPVASIVDSNAPGVRYLLSKVTQPENLRLDAYSAPVITNILSPEETTRLIHRIEQRSGSDLLSAPKVTTLDGRQAHIAVQDAKTIVTGVQTNQQIPGWTKEKGPQVNYLTSDLMFGPQIDLIPHVENGTNIHLVAIPQILEFVGYDDPKGEPDYQFDPKLKAQRPLPRFRTVALPSQALVPDGHTLMLAGPVFYEIQIMKDKVVGLGDIPLIGRLFRRESKAKVKCHLIVLVTPILIDPAGNPLHRSPDRTGAVSPP